MNISLTRRLERMVDQKVESGMYASASEVVREALRLLMERDAIRERKLRDLRRELDVGRKQLDRGEGKPFDADRVRRLLRLRTAERSTLRRKSA